MSKVSKVVFNVVDILVILVMTFLSPMSALAAAGAEQPGDATGSNAAGTIGGWAKLHTQSAPAELVTFPLESLTPQTVEQNSAKLLGLFAPPADGAGNVDVIYDVGCMQESAGFGLNCTANDISIANATNITILDDGCAYPGDTVTFKADFEVRLTAQARYDIGLWFAQDGDPNGDAAKTGTCTAATPAYAPDPPWLDLDEAIAGQQGDTCGDIDDAHNPLYPSVTLTVMCVDDDANGKLDLPNCTSWRQPGDNSLCTSPQQAVPGAPSKCKCDTGFNVDIPVHGQIIVDKVTDPAGDTTSFDFTLTGGPDNVNVPFSLTDASDPFESSFLFEGTYSVVETANANYSTSVTCDDGSPANAIDLQPGEIVTCTFTNKLLTGTLVVEKNLVNDNLGPLTCPDFSYTVDGGTAVPFEEDCSNSQTVLAGSHTVVEVGVPIDGYTTTYNNCTNVNVPAGGTATCTITNDDIAMPAINVEKSSTTTEITAAGQIVPYSFIVTNTGNQTLTGITVTDPNCDADPVYGSGDDNTDSKLQVGETWTYTCSHTVTQVEIEAGGNLSNTVTADSNESEPDIDSLDIPIIQNAALNVEKSSTTTQITTAGQVVPYTFVVTNTGNVTLTGITITDPMCDAAPAYQSGDDNNDDKLDLTETWTYTCDHTVTQAEIDTGGNLSNTVTADSQESEPDTDSLDIPITQSAAIIVVKTSTTVEVVEAGQVVPYTFEVTNEGNVTLTGITVSDPMCDEAPAYVEGDTNGDNKLQTTETWVYSCNHTVTQAEVDAGGDLVNTVTADSNESEKDTDTLEIPVTQSPALTIVKTATPATYDAVGDVIDYSYLVTNSGNVTLYDITVVDDIATVTCPDTSAGVAPEGTITCTASYTITQADLDAGSVTNTAYATDGTTQSEPDSETVTADKMPALTIVKTATPATYDAVGDVIGYSYLVTNSGNVTLYDISVVDDKATVTCPDTSAGLAPVGTITCSASYTITQADLDAGSVTNTAYATDGTTQSEPDSENVTAEQMPAIDLAKSVTSAGPYDSVGDLITYQLVATNTGNVTLTDVSISDPLLGTLTCTQPVDLSPDATLTCTGSYAVTQTDLDAGKVDNTATATGSFGGKDYTDTDSRSVPVTQSAAIIVVKASTTVEVVEAGQVVPYTFRVDNNGNVTLTGILVSDEMCDEAPAYVEGDANGDNKLQVDETWVYTCEHTVTQAEVDAGGNLINTVTADSNESDEDTDTLEIPVTQSPVLTIVKTATPNTYDAVGDVISYSYLVTNSGNITLYGITVVDDKATVTCPDTSAGLAPLGQITCSASYTIQQSDLDVGSVTNSAYATDGTTQSEPDSETVNALQNPHLTLVKSSTFNDENGDGYAQVHETISYSFEVTNDGNVTLYNITITDPKVTVTGGPLASLAAGATDSTTFTGSYKITQADIDAGKVDNTALASGQDPQDQPVSDEDDNTQDLPQNPLINIVKSGTFAAGDDGYANVGELIAYEFLVTNEGNVTLTGITVTDPKVSPITCPADTLAVGASMTCTGTYAVTQADIDAGFVYNLATADSDESEPDDGDNNEPLPQNPAIDIVKTTNGMDGGDFLVGSMINWKYVVTNTGNVTLSNITVSDDKGVSVTCPKTSLAAGESMDCTATGTATLGLYENTGTVTADDPQGDDATDSDDSSYFGADPEIDVEKYVSIDGGTTWVDADTATGPYLNSGTAPQFKFVVTNTGNVALSNVTVTDSDFTLPAGCIASTLAVGAYDECIVTGTWAQGQHNNKATASGSFTDDANATETDTDTDDANYFGADPKIDLTKSGAWVDGNANGFADEGEKINYTFVVKNIGNVALTSVTVTDPKVSPVSCPKTTLAVNESMNCTGSYTLTLADIYAGKVNNTATASGSFTDDNNNTKTVNDPASATVILPLAPTGQILPTQTTCQQFRDGTYTTMQQYYPPNGYVYYMLKGKLINNVNPGVFFYYSKVTLAGGTFSIDVTQSNDKSWPKIPTQVGDNIILWDATCTKVQNLTAAYEPTTGNATISGSVPAGTYYISVKWAPSSRYDKATNTGLLGYSVTGKPMVTYSFQAYLNDSSYNGLISSSKASQVIASKK